MLPKTIRVIKINTVTLKFNPTVDATGKAVEIRGATLFELANQVGSEIAVANVPRLLAALCCREIHVVARPEKEFRCTLVGRPGAERVRQAVLVAEKFPGTQKILEIETGQGLDQLERLRKNFYHLPPDADFTSMTFRLELRRIGIR